MIDCASGTQAAGVFTRNCFRAAPVQLACDHLDKSAPRALLINTGFANAGTGEIGYRDALACCRELADNLDCPIEAVLPFSTGVIGERLPVERIIKALPGCVSSLSASGWKDAAHGILTTDTRAKGCSRRITLGKVSVTITGIAKGAGMIRPDMATMLAFIATDARVSPPLLKMCLQSAVKISFNRITVDGDTSTNDACMLLATGKAQHAPIEVASGSDYDYFLTALKEVCMELAQAIIRDAEGATKFIILEIAQGDSQSDCLQAAYAVAHSPLVKTAFFASDPNWGRILAAVGRAGLQKLDIGAVNIYLNGLCVVKNGSMAETYTDVDGKKVMAEPEITVRVELGAGNEAVQIWTSDLSHDYVRINTEYRT